MAAAAISKPLFTTKMIVPDDTPIIALSDIHADIDALIIALRDCAKVIERNELQFNYDYDIQKTPSDSETNIRLESRDAFLEHLLLLDLDNGYKRDEFDQNVNLGYKWVGGNTHVVIVGDILDGVRPTRGKIDMATTVDDSRYIHQYPQVEIKILKFLNKLDELAESNGGRVIKLIGNHELSNFLGTEQIISEYAFSNQKTQSIKDTKYYQKHSRLDYFKSGFDGYKLYKERGTGILLIINNNIFVHGSLNNLLPYEQIDEINKFINRPGALDKQNKKIYPLIINLQKKNSILWERNMGDINDINSRFGNNKMFCAEVDGIIQNFCGFSNPICDPTKVKIIIGHCPQISSTIENFNNTTFKEILEKTEKTIEYIATEPSHIHSGKANLKDDILFGITMECARPNNFSQKIYRVDVAASRAFDQYSEVISTIKTLSDKQDRFTINTHSNTPQVLKIINDKVSIIKSTRENTRRYQPRRWIEGLIKEVPELNIYGPNFGSTGMIPPHIIPEKYNLCKTKDTQLNVYLNDDGSLLDHKGFPIVKSNKEYNCEDKDGKKYEFIEKTNSKKYPSPIPEDLSLTGGYNNYYYKYLKYKQKYLKLKK